MRFCCFAAHVKIMMIQLLERGTAMNILKKTLSMLLALCMIMLFPVTAFAEEIHSGSIERNEVTPLDEMDALLIAGSILNSADPNEDFLSSENTMPKEVVPLHSGTGEVVAYYVSFSPSGYVVVNNSRSNPAVIEFGEGGQPLIENILRTGGTPHIIYNNPTEIFSDDSLGSGASAMERQANAPDLYSYYPALKENDQLAESRLDQLRKALLPEISVRSSGGYGFIEWDDMPSGSYTSSIIKNAISTDWAITKEFSDIAQNHCGATAVTNFALYFANCGYSNLKINSVYDTFVAVHGIVGNGPVMTIADKAKTYFSNRGYTLNTSSVKLFSGIKTAVKNHRPCGILLANGIVDWHWVICVGYRCYDSGDNYMRIVNGWEDTTERFYLIHSGSMWWSATEYWIA